ncbi:AraC family transcriptional regulator [Thauera propionica]|uniref:AraC family transcriptional regulator n=1 Tax=Thauera propionica TaxID=2019431 RepID=A0A235F1H7_9RHOO|nr:AraC family transcriptional regulator [Thauera propionica]OYD55146.1 AraC family transcriptional regulator [Thauera propionica]
MKILTPSPAELTLGRAATPIAFIRAIVTGYRRLGMDPAKALAQAQIPPALLDDPDARVTAAQMEVMSGAAMQELDDETLGWFSRRLPWGSYGMLCRASLTAPTLEVALKRWCRHHRLLTDDIVLTFNQQRGSATIRIVEHTALGELREFCLVSTLRYLLGYACWLVDSRIALAETTFPFPAPRHADAYHYLFPGPVRFDADAASLSFDARYLELPVRRDEKALQAMLQRALPLTVLQYRRDRLLVHSVAQILVADAAAAHTAEDVAAQLNTSVRTLHRQLKEEGVSLQRLKNEARRERAIKLLLQTRKPVKQVAAAVGFDSEKSFARAFREWTGVAPSAYRTGAPAKTSQPAPPR